MLQRVELRREVIEIEGDPVRLVVGGRDLDLARPLRRLARHRELARRAEPGEVGRRQRAVVGREPRLGGARQHRLRPGMGILDVEDRVVLGLLQDLVEVEVERRVVLPRQHHEPGDVRPDLLDHVAQRHERSGALGHLERLAALEEPDELAELHVERHPVRRESAATAAFIRLT